MDTGIGLTAEQAEKLFVPFSQADGSTTRKYGGSGLGLVISQRLVALMGGKIEVNSRHGKGSVFSFTAQFKMQGKQKIKHQLLDQYQRTMRVLIVDDNETSLSILHDMMASFSYDVVCVNSGRDALRIIEASAATNPFDFILLDWMMPEMDGIENAKEVRPDIILLYVLIPGMDGYEICRRLKKDPDTTDISIIFVTVLGEEGHEARELDLGALDHITKPFNRDIVLARVRNHMALIEAHRLKDDVNRIISHDMRNELSMIIGYPEILLQEQGLNPTNRRMIEKL